MKKTIKRIVKSQRFFPILITLAINLLLAVVSIYLFESYGLVLFFFIPFLMGILPTLIRSRQENFSFAESRRMGVITLNLGCLGLLILALEGMICIAMAYPILWLCMLFGSYLGHLTREEHYLKTKHMNVLLVFAFIGAMGFDLVDKPEKIISATTAVMIEAPIDQVWENVVKFDTIAAPKEWIFKTGIAYPTHATIEGTGIGAVRHCNFTTGQFTEPITIWDEPRLLAFDVEQQPVPMHEINPFWEVHPPHLEGYFSSVRGQFKLSQVGENMVKLEGTTWYRVDIHPRFYWRWWSSFIIHEIHGRVLVHIKSASEVD